MGLQEKSLAAMDPGIRAVEHLVGLSAGQVDLVRVGCHLELAGQAATAADSMFQAVVAVAVQGSQSADQSTLLSLQ